MALMWKGGFKGEYGLFVRGEEGGGGVNKNGTIVVLINDCTSCMDK